MPSTATKVRKAQGAPKAPTRMGAEAILAQYFEQATPRLARLGEIAERLMAILKDPPRALQGAPYPELANTPIEHRVKYLSTLATRFAPGIIHERGELVSELRDIENRARQALDRWLADRRAELEEAKVRDPDAGTTAGQERRMAMAFEADDLSRLPTDQLVHAGQAALARGDLEEAQIRLMAARLRGEGNQSGLVNDFAGALERQLDATLPHRREAAKELEEVHGQYGRTLYEFIYAGELLTKLARDPAPTPDDGAGGVGATAVERQTARAEGHEHIISKLAAWIEKYQGVDQ